MEEGVHVDPEGLVVAVDGGPVGGWAASPWYTDSGEDGADDFLAEDDKCGHGAGGLGRDLVAAGASGFDDEVLAAKFAQVIGALADGVVVAAGDGVDLGYEVGDVEPVGGGGESDNGGEGGAGACLVEVDAPDAGAPDGRGCGSWSRIPSGTKQTSTQSRVVQNRSTMPASELTMSGKRFRTRPTWRALVLWQTASKRSTCSPLV